MSASIYERKSHLKYKIVIKMLYPVDMCSNNIRGHGGRVVTLAPPTSEARVRFTALPQVGKLVVA